MDYTKDIRIDEDGLDVEWLQQASLTYEYAKNKAFTKKILEKKREKLALCKAELTQAIHRNPDKYKIEKVTVAAVDAVILQNDGFQDANNIVIEAIYDNDIAGAACDAISSKKSALENLVKLHGQNYFAGPSIPRDLSEEWISKEKAKKTNEAIADAMPKRRVRK